MTRHIREEYEPDSQTGEAIRFVESQAKSGSPFALFLSWGPPHDPWDDANVPPEYRELHRGVTLPRRPNYSETPDPYADNWAKLPPKYPAMVDAFQRAVGKVGIGQAEAAAAGAARDIALVRLDRVAQGLGVERGVMRLNFGGHEPP